MKRFEKKVVLITGAANGLGFALTQNLAASHNLILAIDIDNRALIRLRALSPGNIKCFTADVSSPEELSAIANEIIDDGLAIDMIINNAAVSHSGRIAEMEMEDFEWVIRTNLLGTYHLTKIFMPLLNTENRAYVVNISSGIAFHGLPHFAAYASSKAGIRTFSQSLRAECKEKNIQVSTVYPGPLKSNITRRSRFVNVHRIEKEHAFLQKRGYDVEIIAEEILTKILSGKEEILLGWEVKLGHWLSRYFPKILSWWVNKNSDRLPFMSNPKDSPDKD